MGATDSVRDDPGHPEVAGELGRELPGAGRVADEAPRADTAAHIPAASSAPDLPGICQSGQRGRVHELSDARRISTGYDVAAGEVIERGTCRCGEYVARFVLEGQTSVPARGPLFPVSELASVVAGLADEPLGPERGLVSCGVCHATTVTEEAHHAGGCPAIPESAAGVNDSEHARLVAAQAALTEIGRPYATDHELAKLAAADPWGEGDVVRGATLGNAERIEPSLAELNRALNEAGKRAVWPYLLFAGFLALLIMSLIAQIFGR